MHISDYFEQLNEAYQAELDDLRSDSEGKDVLRRRLQEKRKEIGFLSQMMETCPEMVAVVFHGAFSFPKPAVMQQVLAQDADDLPDWEALLPALQLQPWAQDLADLLLPQSGGNTLLVSAAALEFLQHHAHISSGPKAENTENSSDKARPRAGGRDLDAGHDFDADDAADQDPETDRDEDSENWLERQGFDRRD